MRSEFAMRGTAALPYWQMVELRYTAMPFTLTTKALWGVHPPGLFGVTRIDAVIWQ